MPRIALLYFDGCANLHAARQQILEASRRVGEKLEWTEIELSLNDCTRALHGYGSPTVLVDGRDVVTAAPMDAMACRLYENSEVNGAPPIDAIVAALRQRCHTESTSKVRRLAVLPGVLFSLLPVLACPSCWPAYAGVLGTLGIPFLMEVEWVLPLTGAALILALAGLAKGARARRGYNPTLLGVIASVSILVGKFWLHSTPMVYVGAAVLLFASAWNQRPKQTSVPTDSCGCVVQPATR